MRRHALHTETLCADYKQGNLLYVKSGHNCRVTAAFGWYIACSELLHVCVFVCWYDGMLNINVV